MGAEISGQLFHSGDEVMATTGSTGRILAYGGFDMWSQDHCYCVRFENDERLYSFMERMLSPVKHFANR